MSVKWTKLRNTICSTCLSRDRKLFPAIEVKQLALFLRDIPLPKIEDRICWECKANVTKMIVFRDNVLKAQTLLAEVFSGRQHENMLQTLTKLTITTKNNYDEMIDDVIKHELCYADLKVENGPATQIFIEPVNESDDENILNTQPKTTTTKGDHDGTVFEDTIKYKLFNTEVKVESGTESQMLNETMNESDEETESETEFKSFRERLEGADVHTQPNDKQVVKSSCEETKNTKELGADRTETDSDSDFNFNGKKTMEDKTLYNTTIDAYKLKKITEEELTTLREKKRTNYGFKNSRHKCLPCLETFNNQKKLEKHMNSKHSAKKHKCKICEQTFSIKKHLDDHFETHYRCYVCSVCGFEHFQEIGMWYHYEHYHDLVNKDCESCGLTFPTKVEYRKHHRETHSKTFTCDLCGLTCKTKFALEQHIETHSANRQRSECTTCHKTYTSKHGLYLHVQRAHSLPTNKLKEAAYCPECDIQFKDKQTYKIHLAKTLKHNSKESFKHKCEQCGHRCQSKSILRGHVESVHSDVKKYSCEICQQAFKTANIRRKHVREKHEGRQKPRNAVCEICTKAFTSKLQLQQHMNSHTGARPYVCSTCGATFSHSGALYTHNRLKHGTKQSLTRKHVDAERNEMALE